ncbi:hypothetical protein Tco_0567968 [Tanacetum coccineum]
MSSSSPVTYTSVYTDSEPGRVFWGADVELSDGGFPRVIVYGYDGLSMQVVPYVPEPEYPEYLVPSDVEEPLEDQPLPADASPTALPPGYVANSDPEDDPKEDPKEDHADYPANGGDGEEEPSDDDNDDDTDDEDEEPVEDEDDDEEEEHLALVDSSVVSVVDHVPSAEDTEAFERDEFGTETVTLEPPMSPSMEARIAEYAAAPTPPSPLSPWSSPLPQIPSPPLHVSSPPLPLPPPTVDSSTYVEAPLGYRAVGIRLRASSPSTHHPLHPSSPHLPPPVPTSLPLPSLSLPPLPASLFIPPPVDRREEIPEAELPPRKRLCLTTPTSRNKVEESSTVAPRPTGGHRADYRFIGTIDAEIRRQRAEEVGYGIRDVWVDPTKAVEEVAPTTLDDRQTQLSQRVDRLVEDRQFHYETARLLDQEALVSREAWAYSVGLSSAVHYELQAYRTHTQMHDYRIASQESLMTTLIAQNNISPRRTSATTARADAAAVRAIVAAPMTAAAVEQLIEARVYAAHANHETLRNSTNGHGDGSHNSNTGIRGTVRTLRECTYKDFLNCKPLTFKGTEGVVVLSQWFEKIESVFHISNCAVENQVKFATCTFLGNALTWWNFHMKTITQDVTYAMDWKALKKIMTVKYCLRGEIKKLEIELWNLDM